MFNSGLLMSVLCHSCEQVSWNDPAWALFMGFEHERIHIETSSVLYRELPLRLVGKPPQWPQYGNQITNTSDFPEQVIRKNPLLTVPAGDATLGKPRDQHDSVRLLAQSLFSIKVVLPVLSFCTKVQQILK